MPLQPDSPKLFIYAKQLKRKLQAQYIIYKKGRIKYLKYATGDKTISITLRTKEGFESSFIKQSNSSPGICKSLIKKRNTASSK